VPRHVAWLISPLVVDYTTSHRLVVDYFTSVACLSSSARRMAHHVVRRRLLCLTQARRRLLCLTQAHRRLLRLPRASVCLGTSRASSRGSSRRSSPTTPPRAGSSSTTSPLPRVRVPRLVARLVAWLGVDYFDYAVRPGASACGMACHAAHRRLLRLRRASACLGPSRGSPRGSSSTTSPTPCVWVPRHVARLIVWLVVDYFASHRLVRRASWCLGTSHGMSRGSSSTTLPRAGLSSTTSPTPRDRVPRHVARLVVPLVVDYFAYTARLGASARRAARHTAHRRLLRAQRLRLVATLALLQPRCAS
jgi:hypothetical protein